MDYTLERTKKSRFVVNIDNNHAGQAEARYYDKLPRGTYFCEGHNGSVKGQAMWFGWNGGTSLTPIKHADNGENVIEVSRAGQEIK